MSVSGHVGWGCPHGGSSEVVPQEDVLALRVLFKQLGRHHSQTVEPGCWRSRPQGGCFLLLLPPFHHEGEVLGGSSVPAPLGPIASRQPCHPSRNPLPRADVCSLAGRVRALASQSMKMSCHGTGYNVYHILGGVPKGGRTNGVPHSRQRTSSKFHGIFQEIRMLIEHHAAFFF